MFSDADGQLIAEFFQKLRELEEGVSGSGKYVEAMTHLLNELDAEGDDMNSDALTENWNALHDFMAWYDHFMEEPYFFLEGNGD